MNVRHVVLSGCSGGGKSTLLAELDRRGFATVCEPGRRIVEEELRGDGAALPWIDLTAFAARAIEVAADDRRRMADQAGWVFFDRGLVDAAVALQHATGQPAREVLAPWEPYHRSAFLTPPWPDIYVTDDERRHDMAEAAAEYERLLIAYRALGYDAIILPKVGVADRADFILRQLG
ncbi:AAA family ATPase [Antarcticirhabdus aurantiaca]|uniref:AAA family ATPase n=1 Tax=Antarcticirhabdus aurantiaca TaxID=2606717 RepID=A0ACD4NLP4_9HYPH|nr:AAA family ATPase [Antarcticirhabdus aurantiaca]WAJ27810.1 AAA family ATPase [Jeongeuplla avenae]